MAIFGSLFVEPPPVEITLPLGAGGRGVLVGADGGATTGGAGLGVGVLACAGGALVEVRYAVKANRIGENGGRTLSGWSRYGQSCIGNHGADLVVSLLRGFGKKIVSDGRTAGRRTEGGDAR